MGATFRDRLGSLFMLVFIAILWIQRDYTTPFGGIFPDRILILMAIFVIMALILSFTPYRVMKEVEEESGENRWSDVAVVIAIMLSWVLLLRCLGFILTSLLGFTSIAWYISGERKNGRTIVKALVVALAITLLIVYIFGHLLLVPIPPGEIFE